MSAPRTYGLAKLIEEALIRPVHRPVRHQPHLAQEYEELATRAADVNGTHQNRAIAVELRRTLRGTDA